MRQNKWNRLLAHGAALLLFTSVAGLAPAAWAQTGVIMSREQLQALLDESSRTLESLRAARKQSVPHALARRQDGRHLTFQDDLRQNVLVPEARTRLEALKASATNDLRARDLPGAQLNLSNLRRELRVEIERANAIVDYWNGVALRWKSGRALRNALLRAHGIEPTALSKEAELLEAQFDQQIESRQFAEAMHVTRPRYLEASKRATPEELQQLMASLESGALEEASSAVPKRQCVATKETSHAELPTPRPREFPSPRDYYPENLRLNAVIGAPVVYVIVDALGCPERALTIESSGQPAMDLRAAQLAADGSYFPAEDDGAPIRSGVSFQVRFDYRQ